MPRFEVIFPNKPIERLYDSSADDYPAQIVTTQKSERDIIKMKYILSKRVAPKSSELFESSSKSNSRPKLWENLTRATQFVLRFQVSGLYNTDGDFVHLWEVA